MAGINDEGCARQLLSKLAANAVIALMTRAESSAHLIQDGFENSFFEGTDESFRSLENVQRLQLQQLEPAYQEWTG